MKITSLTATAFFLASTMALSVTAQDVQTSGVRPVPEAVEPVAIPNVKPRNVVFILSDDHRYDAMSFMGHQFAETPHMDSMAKNGVHLKNAFVTTSLCSPSRASILTGLYTIRHRGIYESGRQRQVYGLSRRPTRLMDRNL